MAMTSGGRGVLVQGYSYKVDPEGGSVGKADGTVKLEDNLGTVAVGGSKAILSPLSFRVSRCTNGGDAIGSGGGVIESDKHPFKNRNSVLRDGDNGFCRGMLISNSSGSTFQCRCKVSVTNHESRTNAESAKAQPNERKLYAKSRPSIARAASPRPRTQSQQRSTVRSVHDQLHEVRQVVSISWIDGLGLPTLTEFQTFKAGLQNLVDDAGQWPFKVMVGLVGTQNPHPPKLLDSAFRLTKHFRAMVGIEFTKEGKIADFFLDPGYTPPVDQAKLPNLTQLAPIPSDPAFYAGELSPVSSVSPGLLNRASTLQVSSRDRVLVSALIKFRAGRHTDQIGIEKANSPYHVPWVWCEFALVSQGDTLKLLANGSRFPSHAWYVNGRRVGLLLQKNLELSKDEPALAAGVSSKDPQPDALSDHGNGPVDVHPNTVKRRRRDALIVNLKLRG